jgi:hypothetical protein
MRQLSKWVVAKKMEQNGASSAELVQLHQSGQFSGDRFGDYYAAAFFATYSFEFAFVISAITLVLHRVHRLVASNSQTPQRWELATRVYLWTVALGVCIGSATNIAAAVFYILSADARSKAGSAWSSNSTVDAANYESNARRILQTAIEIGSVQRYIEALLLLIVIVAFVIVGFGCSRVISDALRALFATGKHLHDLPFSARKSSDQALLAEASAQGRHLRRKIVTTFIFLFLSLLVRSCFSVTYAMASAFQATSCEVKTTFVGCGPFKNTFALILGYILFTPEFQQVVMIISSPLALLVALWGMTGVKEFERLPSAQERLRGARKQSIQQVKPAQEVGWSGRG